MVCSGPVKRLWLIFATLAPLACDRAPQASTTTPPTPSEPVPATQPAVRSPAFIAIEGVQSQFPPAKLTLSSAEGGRVAAELFSDDPPQAFRRSYMGNSFYLPMTLQIDSPARLGEAVYVMRRSANDEADTAAGIFLDNDKIMLTPIELRVIFEPLDERETVVILAGTFSLIDRADANATPKTVKVTARLAAEVKVSP
jgi:hypothetical protein